MNQPAQQTNMAPYLKAISSAKDKFEKQSYAPLVNFDEEAGHAVELLMANEFALKTAQQNPTSVQRAVIKVASIGLTLNKALAYAYLVPRDGQICLDVSYKGLVKLATDSGSIKWAKAEIVRQNDEFEFNGIASEPTHKMNPFSDRGEIIGAYCVAKTADGDFLTDSMSLSEINEIRNTSKAKNAPAWSKWFGEMAKKSIIKRAQKQWPKGNDTRLQEAIHVLNEHEGLEDTEQKANPDDFTVGGELVEPFFDAFFNDNHWLMAEIVERCNETQWPLLMNLLSPVGKQLTVKKNKINDLITKGRAEFRDAVENYKQAQAENYQEGMDGTIEDMPSDYYKQRLIEVTS